MIPFVVTWACAMTFSYKTYQNTIHYKSMHKNTLAEACIHLHCLLMRANLLRLFSASAEHLTFIATLYVPTVWRGPASRSHLLNLKLNFQPLLGFATKLFPPRLKYRKYRHAIGKDRIHWLVRPARTQGQLNTNHHLFLSSDTAALMYNHSFKLELPEEGTTSFNLKV